MTGIVQHASLFEVMTDPDILGPYFSGESWSGWRTLAKAINGEALSSEETKFFQSIAERDPPKRPVKEFWAIAGRRAGKDSFSSAQIVQSAALVDYRAILRPGEKMTAMCLGNTRQQAGIALGYARGLFQQVPILSQLVVSDVSDGLDLSNESQVRVFTASPGAMRGQACSVVVLDECAYASDTGFSSGAELVTAAVPSLISSQGRLLGISTPYRRSGIMWERYSKFFGRDDPDILVIQAASTVLNPSLDRRFIDEALERDPEAAAAEWLARFRTDIGSLVDPALVARLVAPGRHEIPPMAKTSYRAFTDPSDGSADSFTLSICHKDGERAVVDLIRETRPPFSPESVVEEYCDVLKRYGVNDVVGDRYAGEWPREQFRKRGINYLPSERNKSEIYLELLSIINSGRVEFLDHPRMILQLCGLERRTSRVGRDLVDHGPSGPGDDVINSVAGAVVRCLAQDDVTAVWLKLAAADDAFSEKAAADERRAAEAKRIVETRFWDVSRQAWHYGEPPVGHVRVKCRGAWALRLGHFDEPIRFEAGLNDVAAELTQHSYFQQHQRAGTIQLVTEKGT
jgi:hypothetical protein